MSESVHGNVTTRQMTEEEKKKYAPKITKEQYIAEKESFKSDKAIMKKYDVDHNFIQRKKKEWDLIGVYGKRNQSPPGPEERKAMNEKEETAPPLKYDEKKEQNEDVNDFIRSLKKKLIDAEKKAEQAGELESKLAQVEKDMAIVIRERDDLKSKIEVKNEVISANSKHKSEMENEITALIRDRESLRVQLESQSEILERADERNDSVKELQAQLIQKDEHITNLSNALSKSHKERDELWPQKLGDPSQEAELRSLQEENKGLMKEIDRLNNMSFAGPNMIDQDIEVKALKNLLRVYI